MRAINLGSLLALTVGIVLAIFTLYLLGVIDIETAANRLFGVFMVDVSVLVIGLLDRRQVF